MFPRSQENIGSTLSAASNRWRRRQYAPSFPEAGEGDNNTCLLTVFGCTVSLGAMSSSQPTVHAAVSHWEKAQCAADPFNGENSNEFGLGIPPATWRELK